MKGLASIRGPREGAARCGGRGPGGAKIVVPGRVMKQGFANAVAVVTGAGSGLGWALALALGRRGAQLALVDRRADGLAAVAEAMAPLGVTVSTHCLDITDSQAVRALPEAVLARHGRVSCLVNNAGVALLGRFDEVEPEDAAWVLEVNAVGTVRITSAFLPHLLAEERAHLINISSMLGLAGLPGVAAYSASKGAVRGFSEALAVELSKSGLKVTVAYPGGLRSAILDNARVGGRFDPEKAQGGIERARDRLKKSCDVAAEAIIRGAERGRSRVLIGNDARLLDLAHRLLPTRYWSLISLFMSRDEKIWIRPR